MERVDNVVSVKNHKDIPGVIHQLDIENFSVDRRNQLKVGKVIRFML